MVAGRARRLALRGALLGALIALAGPVHAQDAGPYPFWFPDDLGIASLDEIPAALAAPFAPGEEIQFEHDPHARRRFGPGLVWAANCNEFMTLEEDIPHWARIDNDRIGRQAEISDVHRLRCYVLRALLRARPAERSFVRDFVMDENAPDYLPRLLGGHCRTIRAVIAANVDGVPMRLREWERPPPDPDVETVVIEAGDETYVGRVRVQSRLYADFVKRIVGRGDFDDDGLDDLLILASFYDFAPVGGEARMAFRALIITTRTEAGAVLRATETLAPWFGCNLDIKVEEGYLAKRRGR